MWDVFWILTVLTQILSLLQTQFTSLALISDRYVAVFHARENSCDNSDEVPCPSLHRAPATLGLKRVIAWHATTLHIFQYLRQTLWDLLEAKFLLSAGWGLGKDNEPREEMPLRPADKIAMERFVANVKTSKYSRVRDPRNEE
ncbi:uncharacterized protein FIBRA_00878 [Fibroporia radiculosa]|uniref:Uncharacterized protein n=1 Tax=Fibroporia radiculosa TaxID=599839 RepID=J4I865_9APHY|nr:uncharacterized protein FIBRA_00878 [Fibroporia radiculosa]CCL98871.1 predicted protein [Fibroporia radiculosa]